VEINACPLSVKADIINDHLNGHLMVETCSGGHICGNIVTHKQAGTLQNCFIHVPPFISFRQFQ
jgi:hypothetical protein